MDIIKRFLIILIIVLSASSLYAQKAQKEAYYSDRFCLSKNGRSNVRTKYNTYVDCVTKEYAIEADFGSKWAEAIGQSLHYSMATGLPPAILLILDDIKSNQDRYLQRLQATLDTIQPEVKVFLMRTSSYPTR